MKIIKLKNKMKLLSDKLKKSGNTIGFVPTMGSLHQGHISLINHAIKKCDRVVVSIFVNPIQFGRGEDLKNYPRDNDSDIAKCKKAGVDIMFLPEEKEIYPQGFQTYVNVSQLSNHLCGLSRPGHFIGVATVVLKLLNIVKPDRVYFGEKDYQQLLIIKQMASDLEIETKIVNVPIVREEDGLAMSSRNKYLDKFQRKKAGVLFNALRKGEELIRNGEKNSEKIISALKEMIISEETGEIDYINICNPHTLENLDNISGDALIAIAVKIGSARLIDNRLVKI